MSSNYRLTQCSSVRSMMTAFALSVMPGQGSMIAYWDFEGDLVDSVSVTAGTASGDASASGAALAPTGGNSLLLDGADDFVSSNTGVGLGGTGSFTVLAFVQTTATSDGTVFSHYLVNNGGGGLRLIVMANGDLRIEMNAGAGFVVSDAGWDLNDGAVHMIAAVFDSGAGDSFYDVDLYVDETLYDVTSGTDHPVNLDVATNIRFGSDQAGNRDFNGLIDDIAIFNEALSLSALDDIRANGVPAVPVVAQIKITSAGFNGSEFEVVATGLDASTQYVLKRSENLTDGFPSVIDGPRLPTADASPETDTFIDTSPTGSRGFYRIEEAP